MKRFAALFLVSLALLLLAGCGRDTSTPDKAIIGHWRTSDRVYDVYITGNSITSYDLKGETSAREYTVDSMDEESRVICLREKSEESGINEMTCYQFSSDYDSMRAYRDAALEKPLGDIPYVYIDDRTSP